MGQPTEFNIYGYDPSIPAAAVFLGLYNLILVVHVYLSLYKTCRKPKSHLYTIPLFCASLLSVLGYGVRIASCNETDSIPLYAQAQSYIVIAPIFVCASLYLYLRHLILVYLSEGPEQTIFGLPPRWLGRIYICSDVFSFLTQCAGSGIASSGSWEGNTLDIGVNILLTGLALQLATFTFYLLFLWRFVCRVHKAEGIKGPLRNILYGVWTASILVQIRTIFRMIEFALGIEGYPFSNEWCLYVFEAVPMFIALSALAYSHPIRWLGRTSENTVVSAEKGSETHQVGIV